MHNESAATLRSDMVSASEWPSGGDTRSAATLRDLQENDSLHARIAELQTELLEKQQLLEQGQAEHQERIEDIVVLTGHFRGQMEAAQKQATAQAAELLVLRQQVQELAKKLDKVGRHRDRMLNSTSWKITAPIRAVMRTLRGY